MHGILLPCQARCSKLLQKWVCRTADPTFATSVEPMAHHGNLASLCFFPIDITLVDNYLNWLKCFLFLILMEGQLVFLIDCMIFISPVIDVIRMFIWSLFLCITRHWMSSPIDLFPLTYDPNDSNPRVNKLFLSLGSS